MHKVKQQVTSTPNRPRGHRPSCCTQFVQARDHNSSRTPTVSVLATGLNNPRGLKFGPDGYLYVAEGGVGGSQSTIGQCEQVPFPIGPYTGSDTGSRISKISPAGERTTVVDNLPSSQTTPETGAFVSGVGDIAFIGHTLYAVLSGAGCSHGVPEDAERGSASKRRR